MTDQEKRELFAKIEPYLTHINHCAIYDFDGEEKPCDCGLDKIFQSFADQQEPQTKDV